jgi:uncharacterized membrane protein
MEINWLPWVLLAHVLSAIVAFGPVIAFPVEAARAGRDPGDPGFKLLLSRMLEDRWALAFLVLQVGTGVLLIALAGWDLAAPRGRWLIASIGLYVVAIAVAGVQRPRTRRLIELLAAPSGSGAPPGLAPDISALVASVQRSGAITSVLVVVIVLLMVVKPSI